MKKYVIELDYTYAHELLTKAPHNLLLKDTSGRVIKFDRHEANYLIKLTTEEYPCNIKYKMLEVKEAKRLYKEEDWR